MLKSRWDNLEKSMLNYWIYYKRNKLISFCAPLTSPLTRTRWRMQWCGANECWQFAFNSHNMWLASPLDHCPLFYSFLSCLYCSFNCVNQVDSIVQFLIKLLTNRLCNYAMRVRFIVKMGDLTDVKLGIHICLTINMGVSSIF